MLPIFIDKKLDCNKKRIRLEKNAISARMSRQRKKLYILLLQTQIPVMRAKINRYKACMPLKAITYALKLKQTRGDCDLPIGDLYPYELVSQLLLFPTRYGKQIKHKDNCPESDCRVNNKVRNSDNKSEKSDDPYQ